MGRDRVKSSNPQTKEVLTESLLSEFQVSREELYKVFLCITAHRQKGWSFKKIMSAIGNNSEGIGSNIMQFFAVIGYHAMSGQMVDEIINKKNRVELPSKD